jgi:hypothetical protein
VTPPEFLLAVAPVTACFEQLGVDYYVTGSVASSHLGIARATLDVDLVAALQPQHADAVVAALGADYYVDLDAVVEAIRRRAMFNAIHLATMIKVDVYVMASRFDRIAMARRRDAAFDDDPATTRLMVATAEDVIVNKLLWYRTGGEVSERQWGDVLGVLRVQRARLDLDHIRTWGRELGVDDLVERALREAGEPDAAAPA